MAGKSSDPTELLTGLVRQAGRRIKFAPGVIGKSTFLYLGALALWGFVLWRLTPDNWPFNGVLFLVGLLGTLFVRSETKKMRDFAVENPALALMEGADITEFKRFEAQAKGLPSPDRSPVIVDPSGPSKPIPHQPSPDA